MTTALINTVTPNVDTAGNFSIVANEFHNLMIAAGFVRTADTGQLDLGAIAAGLTAPSFTTTPLIYRTNDAYNHIYLRILFGRGGSSGTGAPRISVQAAYSTDGAGNLTGTVSPVLTTRAYVSNTGTVYTAAPTIARACTIVGCYWVEYKSGWQIPISGTAAMRMTCATIVLSRFCNSSGAPTNDGFSLMLGGGHSQASITLANMEGGYACQAVAGGDVSSVVAPPQSCLIPFGVGPGLTGSGQPMVWKHYTAQPRPTLNPYVLTRNTQAVLEGTEKALVVGGVTRNYIALGATSFMRPAVGASEYLGLMLPWE